MATYNRLNEGKSNRNKKEFEKNMDLVKFPKRKVDSSKLKEERQKAWLRNILLDDAGDYPGLEKDVQKEH